MRKTAKVFDVVTKCNDMIARSSDEEARKVLCTLIESVLHDADAYAGFGNSHWLDEGHVNWRCAGAVQEDIPQFQGSEYDRTYFVDSRLK